MIGRFFAALLLSALPAAFAGAPSFAGEAPSVADTAAIMQARYGHLIPKRWGETLPGVVSRLTHTSAVALTLDACGGVTDTRIIALLRAHNVPATIFATNIWLRYNKTIAGNLAADPLFTLAAHGKRHKPASVNGKAAFGIMGTHSIPSLVEEIADNLAALAAITGKQPLWYRSATAHYDDLAVMILHDMGMKIAGYTVNADAGATLPAEKVAARILAAPQGAIILCHCNRPESGTYAGLAKAIPAMLEKGVRFVSLAEAGI